MDKHNLTHSDFQQIPFDQPGMEFSVDYSVLGYANKQLINNLSFSGRLILWFTVYLTPIHFSLKDLMRTGVYFHISFTIGNVSNARDSLVNCLILVNITQPMHHRPSYYSGHIKAL